MPHLTAEAYLTVASILAGFGITVLIFRVQRELQFESNPDHTRLSWADYLVIAAVSLTLWGVVLPLVVISEPGRWCFSIAAGSCAAASVLLSIYPFAIIDHYRIEWGKSRFRTSATHAKGEPGEKVLVILAFGAAILLFTYILVRGS